MKKNKQTIDITNIIYIIREQKVMLDKDLRSQSVTAKSPTVGNYMSRSLPYVFTEAGSFSLSFVLSSQKAIEMGQFIIRAFTHLRRFILKNENLMMEF